MSPLRTRPRGERFNLPAVAGVLALHAAAALAWQPPQGAAPKEVVLKAVLLPTVQPRREEPRPEPPPPARPMRAQPPSSRAVHQAAPELSDEPAEPVAAPREVAAALSPAQAVHLAMARPADGATQVSDVPSLATVAPALRAASLHARPAEAAPVRHAATGAETTSPADHGVAVAPRPVFAPALSVDQRGAPMARATAAAAEVSQGRAVSLDAAPWHAVATPKELAIVANPTTAQAGSPTSGAATLVEPGAATARSLPTARAARLAHALPGRPLPVATAEGVTESVDYAENNPEFIYPRLAVRLGLEGTVLLRVEVLPDGRPGQVRIQQSSGHDVLDQDALRQIATWRFKPPQRLGRTHASQATVPIDYRLHKRGKP
jgi:protein TonB